MLLALLLAGAGAAGRGARCSFVISLVRRDVDGVGIDIALAMNVQCFGERRIPSADDVRDVHRNAFDNLISHLYVETSGPRDSG